ncbi:MAG: hypothetical protein JW712_03635 [Dehalococcoidales bacterium]|nr:hypothetical protein [Dehalococcoidales bacterium]
MKRVAYWVGVFTSMASIVFTMAPAPASAAVTGESSISEIPIEKHDTYLTPDTVIAVSSEINPMTPGTLQYSGLTFETGGDANWFTAGDVLQSGDIGDDQISWLRTTVTGPMIFDVDMIASSEGEGWFSDGDVLSFSIDGEEQDSCSGDFDINHKMYSVGSGVHTLYWSYTKDGSVSEGYDCGRMSFEIATVPGTGTESDPWSISTPVQFLAFSFSSEYWGEGTWASLVHDLDMEDVLFGRTDTYDYHLGGFDNDNNVVPYNGTFDGNGHIISNYLKDIRNAWFVPPAGLFSVVGETGTVKNLRLEDCVVAGEDDTGILCGRNEGTIINCHVADSPETIYLQVWGTYVTSIVSSSNTGGLVGYNDGGTIIQCSSTAGVRGTKNVGGLVGLNENGTIQESFASTAVLGDEKVGGLCGCNNGGTIVNCYSTGACSGVKDASVNVFDAEAMPKSGYEGIMVSISFPSSVIGGLCGQNSHDGLIDKCYSRSVLASGSNIMGGLLGSNSDWFGMFPGTVTNSFWSPDFSGTASSAGGTECEAVQFLAQSTFESAGWDFSSSSVETDGTWLMDPYPALSWDYHIVTIDSEEHGHLLNPNKDGKYYIRVRDGTMPDKELQVKVDSHFYLDYPDYTYRTVWMDTDGDPYQIPDSLVYLISSKEVLSDYTLPIQTPYGWINIITKDIDAYIDIMGEFHSVTFVIGDLATRIGGGELHQYAWYGDPPVLPELEMAPGYFFDGWNPPVPSAITEDFTTYLVTQGDVDLDGVPDAWEVAQYGSTTATDGSSDFDGDGRTDSQEFADDTDPLDLYSVTGLLACYPLSGNADDVCAGQHNGVPFNGVTFDTKYGSIDNNGAALFDGTDDYINLGSWMDTDDMSVITWFKTDTQSEQKEYLIGEAGGWVAMLLNQDAASMGQVNFSMPRNVNGTTEWIGMTTIGEPLNDNDWHCLAVTYDGYTARLYIDGVFARQTNPSSTYCPPVHSLPLYLGGSANLFNYEGLLDEVRIYDRVLDADEIARLYNGATPAYQVTFQSGALGSIENPNSGSDYVTSVIHGNTIPDVSIINIDENYAFTGWDFQGTITSDTVINALYETVLQGTGVIGDPYLISDTDDFDIFCGDFRYWDNDVRLENDLDLFPTIYDNAPIAPDTPGFTGVFDGNSHVIRNLRIDTVNQTYEYAGLFGVLDGLVTRLGLEDCVINSKSTVGGLSGRMKGGNITECFVSGTVVSTWMAGLLVGNMDGGRIENCYTEGGVSGYYAGGLGYYQSSGTTVSNCYSAACINSKWGSWGLFADAKGTVTGCFCDMEVSTMSKYSFLTGTGLTTWDMTIESNFTDQGWDFTDTWVMNGYPVLQWQTMTERHVIRMHAGDHGTFNIGGARRAMVVDDGNSIPSISITIAFNYAFSGWDDVPVDIVIDSDIEITALYRKVLEGSGQSTDPFIISNIEDWKSYARDERYLSYDAVLDADLDLRGETLWPLAGYGTGKSLSGTFNGNGYVIENGILPYSLFWGVTSSGTIKYLGLQDLTVQGNSALCGTMAGVIRECFFSGSITNRNYAPTIGGLCFRVTGKIYDSYVSGEIKGSNDTGGICGIIDNGTLYRCYSTANITGYYDKGGIYASIETGINYDNGTYLVTPVSGCYWDTEATGTSWAGCHPLTPQVGAYGKTTADMQLWTTFGGWNWATTWMMNGGYPELRQLNQHTVIFQPGEHGRIVEANSDVDMVQRIPYGYSVTVPEVEVLETDYMYRFSGWLPAIPATITENFTTTAQYEPKTSFSILLHSGDYGTIEGADENGDLLLNIDIADYGVTFPEIAVDINPGYKLVGWDPPLPETITSDFESTACYRLVTPGYALDLDGTDDYVRIDDADALDLTGNFTVECWFKADTIGSAGTIRGLISKYHTSGSKGFVLRLIGSELNIGPYSTSGLGLVPGRWYHAAFVHNAVSDDFSLYVNGVSQVLTGTLYTLLSNSDPVRIGSDYSGRYFDGQIDEVRLWTTARTESQLRENMFGELSGNETGLVAYYPFGQISDTTVADETNDSLYDGTLVNVNPATVKVPSTFPCIDDTPGSAVWTSTTPSFTSGRLTLDNGIFTGTDFVVFNHNDGTEEWVSENETYGFTTRLSRIWHAQVAGTVNATVRIDTTGLDISDPSQLRLLVADTDHFTEFKTVPGLYDNQAFTIPAYELQDDCYFTLVSVKDVGSLVIGDSVPFIYDGSPQTPEPEVKDGETVLTKDIDYTLSYVDNVHAGNATMILTGSGHYGGTQTREFSIIPRELIITPDAGQFKVQGQNDPVLTFTYSGNVAEEIPGFTGELSRIPGEEAGPYEILEGTLALDDTSSFMAADYRISFTRGIIYDIMSGIFILLHSGENGVIQGADEDGDLLIAIDNDDYGIPFPEITVNANTGYRFAGWDPPLPETVTSNFESTACYSASTPGFALDLDGINDYVTIPDADELDLTDTFTFECWFNPDTIVNQFQGLISKHQTPLSNGFFISMFGPDLWFSGGTTTGLGLVSGRWYHAAFVKNGGTRSLYINGVSKPFDSYSYTLQPNNDPIRIGSDFSERYFNGQIDEVRIWSIAHTESQIRESMFQELSGNETGLVSWYSFNQGTNAVVIDDSIHTHDGTPVNINPDTAWVPSTFPFIDSGIPGSTVWSSFSTNFTSGRLTLDDVVFNSTDFITFDHNGGTEEWASNNDSFGFPNRLSRIWHTKVAGTVTAAIRIDTTGLDITDPSQLRLLVSKIGDLSSFETVSGVYDSQVFIVPSREIKDNRYFTLVSVKDVESLAIADPGLCIYDGNPQTPEPEIKDGETVLTRDVDYTLSFADNVHAGNATLILTGMGHYGGTQDQIFSIKSRNLTVIPDSGQNKIQGDDDPVFTYTWSGNVAGETPGFTGTLSRTAGEDEGTYEIQVGTLAMADTPSFRTSDYHLSFSPGVLFTVRTYAVLVLHSGDNGHVQGADENGDIRVKVELADSKMPQIWVFAHDGYSFTGWDPPLPETVTHDFESTACYQQTQGFALNMDGVDDHVRFLPANTPDFTDNFTIECWFKTDENSNIYYQGLISKYRLDSYGFYLGTKGESELYTDSGYTSGLGMVRGLWYHAAYVNDNGTRTLYVNGVPKTISGYTTPIAGGENWMLIGERFEYYDQRFWYFDGQIDEVRIWSIARTENQVRDTMYRELSGNESGLLAYYSFNHVSGTLVNDDSTNSYNGTMHNMNSNTSLVPGTFPCTDDRPGSAVWISDAASFTSGRLTMENAAFSETNFIIFDHNGYAEEWADKNDYFSFDKHLSRVWHTRNTGTVTSTIRIDTTGLDIPDGTMLRLLVFNADYQEVQVIPGTYADSMFTVPGQNIGNGYYFTLVTVDSFDNATVSDSGPFTYNGNPQTPEPEVKDGETVLTKGVDYTLSYADNVHAGNATLTITGTGGYIGTQSKTFVIEPRELTVTPDAGQSKVQGDNDPVLTCTWSGNVAGETPGFTGTIDRVPGEDVGDYEIQKGTLALTDSPSFHASDYYLSFTGGVLFTISERPPLVVTGNVTSITNDTAVLNGTLTDKGTASSVQVSFVWGLTSETEPSAYPEETANTTRNTTGSFAAVLTGLVPGQTRYFRAKAVGDGTVYGDEQSFTVPEPKVSGDVNDDGQVDVLDLTNIIRMILVLDLETPAADINQDGKVNVLDATQVVRIILGIQ